MSGSRRTAIWSSLVLLCTGLTAPLCQAADLPEIIRRGTAAIQSDWTADAEYAYVERDEVQKDEKQTSKTYLVVIMAGSDYNLPIAVNDQPLSPDQKKAELEKLRNELRRRESESAPARRQRVDHYRKERDENGTLLLEFPKAFTFEILREEELKGHPAYVLSATPKRQASPLSRAAKVLSGMRGTLWIDQETFHVLQGECTVVSPIPIYGILARLLPGTHIKIETMPVTVDPADQRTADDFDNFEVLLVQIDPGEAIYLFRISAEQRGLRRADVESEF